MKERDIATLITKVNDRNLQKRRETGLTSYALISLIVILAYRLISILPELHNTLSIGIEAWRIVLVITNIYLGFVIVISSFLETTNNKTQVRLTKRSSVHYSFLERINFSLFIIIPFLLSLNYYLSKKDYYSTSSTFFFAIILILDILTIFRLRKKRKYRLIPVSKTGVSYEEKDSIVIFAYTVGISIIIGSTLFLFLENFIVSIEEIALLTQFSIIVYSIPIIISFLFQLKNTTIRNKKLEDLEVEIYLNQLTDDEIIERLREKYWGLGIKNWIEGQVIVLDAFFEELNEELLKLSEFITSTKTISEEQYPREVKMRKQEIQGKINELKLKIQNLTSRLNLDIENILDEAKSQLEKYEKLELVEFQESTQKRIDAKLENLSCLQNDTKASEA